MWKAKYVAPVIALILFASVAAPIHAASLTDSQIQAILGLLTSFGADSAVIANVHSSLRGQAPSVSASPTANTSTTCAHVRQITRTLYEGLSDTGVDGQITLLQKFLAEDNSIYPEGRVTGYFGPATERAVERWQAKYGVVSSGTAETTGYGVVGLLTREAFAKRCGVTPSTQTPPASSYTPPASSAPTCTYTSNSNGKKDSIDFSNRAGNADSCREMCTIVRNEKYGLSDSGTCVYTGAGGVGQTIINIQPVATSPAVTTPSVTVTNVTSANIAVTYANLPANSQIRFVNASTGQPYYAQSTMAWSGGSGSLSITIPNDLPGGTYYLRATDYYNPNTVVAQSGTFQAGTNVQTNPVVINSFTASPSTVNTGGAVLFTWGSNLNSTDISFYGGGCSIEGLTQNNVALQVTPGFVSGGTVTYVPPATATYTLRCSSGAKDGSPSATKQITVTVGQPQTNPVVISSFTPSQTSVTSGQSITLTWNSNLTSNDISYYGGFCSISAITSYNQQIHIANGAGASGSITYTPALTATYTLTCSAGGKDGSPMDTEQATVSVQ